MAEIPYPVGKVNEDYGHPKHRARRSGGFLLEETAPPHANGSLKTPRQRTTGDGKGKERAEDGAHGHPRRTHGNRHRQTPSIGSSPLSTVIYNGTNAPGTRSSVDHDPHEILPSQPGSSAESSASQSRASRHGQHSRQEGHSTKTQSAPNALGHDTDPAQIVNLALNLSESRRRNVSGARLSPVYIDAGRRHLSSEGYAAGMGGKHLSAGGANLRRHLNDQRRISRTSATKSTAYSGDTPSPKSIQSSKAEISPGSGFYDPHIAQGAVLHPSEATLARVEKARIAFELSYEYRRLLQYLLKLPAPSGSRPSSSREDRKSEAEPPEELGRAYNPLQYIRNRRVRGREGSLFDAEAEGFKNTDRVKLWVDTIASERHSVDFQGHETLALPSLDLLRIAGSVDQSSHIGDDSGGTEIRPKRSEKQSLKRAFTPWDLLADAAWVSRDDNIKKLEDAKGNKLLPLKKLSDTDTPRTSAEQVRTPNKRSLSLGRPAATKEQLSGEPDSQKKRKRLGHLRAKSHEPTSPLVDNDSPQGRRGRWRRNFVRSRNASSSEGSPTQVPNDYFWGRHHDRNGIDSAVLEKHMRDLLASEIGGNSSLQRQSEDVPKMQSSTVSRDNAEERKHSKNTSIGSKVQVPVDINKGKLSRAIGRKESTRNSLDEQRGRQPRVSLDGRDLTAPNSPKNFHFGPSIFLNRSAPNSRSVSPKKSVPSVLRPPMHHRSDSRRSVSENDFAANNGSPLQPEARQRPDLTSRASRQNIHESDSGNHLLSPVGADHFAKRFRNFNNSTSSIKDGGDSRDPESRFKGLLKGTRVAALVGNEVSRFGDMIWRRDGSKLSRPTSPSSPKAAWDSDTDGGYSTLENSPETDLSRVTTNNEDGGQVSRVSTRNTKPKYHYQNLPTFRSSVSQASPDSPQPRSPEDHPITRQQLAQKARGRSTKFERLAPPKIDMRSISPSASPPRSRTQPTGDNDDSRGTSTSRSNHIRVRSADRRLNDVLGIPGTVRSGVAPTGLAALPSTTKRPTNSTRPGIGDRQWSISDRSVSNTRTDGTISKRDIARVRALLLSSGIKANEIARQANSIEDPPFLAQLRDLHARAEGPIQKVPRAQEHLLTARLMVKELDARNHALRSAADAFSSPTVTTLHDRFRTLGDRVVAEVIAGARRTADEADELNTALTTTWTLETRNLSERVEVGLRRRRRRFRWVRRGGWVLLEWVLVAVMWAVWGVVVVVRGVRGLLGAVLGVIKWMLWL